MANYVDRISLNGNTADIIGISNDGYYPGVDLTVKHAEEIASYDNVWAWIKARITAGNYSQSRFQCAGRGYQPVYGLWCDGTRQPHRLRDP